MSALVVTSGGSEGKGGEPDEASALAPETLSPLPRPSPLRVLARLFLVSAIIVWFSLRRLAGAITGGLDGPSAMRLAFERLGPIYVKLGQLVASGEALFPERYSEAFRTLLDRVPPFSFSEVERIVREDLGEAPDELYAELDPTPLAAASIAQVHPAKLRDGREVVVKVQRPGIGALAAADVAIMRFFAWIATKFSRLARNSNVVAFVDDFAINLAQELDFRREAQRMRDFNAVMRAMGNDITAAPEVVDDLTHARVLTMERFRGWRIDDVEQVQKTGFDVEERLLQGIRAWFQTLITEGFFHGDVHAGNFMLLSDGRVGFLDFGIVGSFGPQFRRGVLEYVLGFQQRDWGRVADAMLAMETAVGEVDRDALTLDLEATFAPMIDPEEGFKLKDLVPGLIGTGRKHGLRLPRDLVLVTKQLVYLDRYSRAYGGAKMNVLTDQRLTNLILQDMFAAMFAR